MALRISPAAARAVAHNTPFRQARTCYGHLAGVAGVTLLDALWQRGWVSSGPVPRGGTGYRLTAAGMQALACVQEQTGRACLDWTERRPHLGGPLGRALTARLIADGVLRLDDRPRHLTVAGSVEVWLSGHGRAGIQAPAS